MTGAPASAQLATALGAALPSGWNVIRVGREPDSVTKPTVIVYREGFEPDPSAPHAATHNDFTVWVVVDSTAHDDTLDDQADTLARAIDAIPWAIRGKAERDIYRDNWPGFRFTVTGDTRYQEDTP